MTDENMAQPVSRTPWRACCRLRTTANTLSSGRAGAVGRGFTVFSRGQRRRLAKAAGLHGGAAPIPPGRLVNVRQPHDWLRFTTSRRPA